MNDRINGQMTSPMKRILVLISGSGSNLQAILDGCAGGKIAGQVVGVISNKADAYGLVRAREAGVATAILAQQQFASREEYDVALLALLTGASMKLRYLHRPANLEDLFLKLTGREMRE